MSFSAPADRHRLRADLRPCWLVVFAVAAVIAAGSAYCLIAEVRFAAVWPEQLRIRARTACYIAAIIAFPLINLTRYIQVRLNAVMPGLKTAKRRYLTSVAVSMTCVGLIGLTGIMLYMAGDGANTLYIFSGLALLGAVLYRPKTDEYRFILQSLSDRFGQ